MTASTIISVSVNPAEQRQGYPGEQLPSLSSSDYRHAHGSIPGALLYVSLFCPDFVVDNDRVIIDDGTFSFEETHIIEDRLKNVIQNGSIDSYNWREIPYLFADRCGSEKDCDLLANIVRDCWQNRLQFCFPDRCFVVEVLSDAESGGTASVGFRELRST